MLTFNRFEKYRIKTPAAPTGRVYYVHAVQNLPDGSQNVLLGTHKPSFSNDIGYGGTVNSSQLEHAEKLP